MDRELNAAERTLFAHVAYDIREHPDKYREAGRRLDHYYDDDKLCWERRQLELMRQIKRIEDGVISEFEEECLLPELKESLANELPPPLWMRLAYALEDLWLDYRMGGILAEEDARAILIITWVATNAEANRIDLGITKFADLPWKKARLGFIHDLFLERKAITSRTHFFKYDDESFLRLVYIAWQKLFGGTIDGAMIIKEMRRALVGEKRLSGLDEQNNMDAVRNAIAKLEAEKPAETGKKDEPCNPLSWIYEMYDSVVWKEFRDSGEQWVGPFDPILRFHEDTESLTDILTLKDCITHLKKILPYWMEYQFVFPKSDILADITHTIRCWLIRVRHNSNQKLPPIPPDLIGMVDWIPGVEKILAGGTTRKETEQVIKPGKGILLESICRAYEDFERLAETDENLEKLSFEETTYAEAVVIDYLTEQFGEQDDALGNWPNDWHECPEAFNLYKAKIREFRAGQAKASLDEVKRIAEAQPEHKIEVVETGKKNKSGKKTKTKKLRKRKIKLTDKQKEIWESIKGGATVSELAAEQGCSKTNIRQQYAKAEAKLKKLNTGSKSVNFRTIGQIPKDRRGQETLEGKRKTI